MTTSPPTPSPRPSASPIDVRDDARALLAGALRARRGRAERGAPAHGADPRGRDADRQPGLGRARASPSATCMSWPACRGLPGDGRRVPADADRRRPAAVASRCASSAARATSPGRCAGLAARLPDLSIGSYPFQQNGRLRRQHRHPRLRRRRRSTAAMARLSDAVPRMTLTDARPPLLARDRGDVARRRPRLRRALHHFATGRAAASASQRRDGRRPAPNADLAVAEAAMRARGQSPLFMIRAGDADARRGARGRGYATSTRSRPIPAPPRRRSPDPPAARHRLRRSGRRWPSSAEIWAEGGIGPARLAVMERVRGPQDRHPRPHRRPPRRHRLRRDPRRHRHAPRARGRAERSPQGPRPPA